MTDEALIARLRGWARDIQTGSTATWAMDQDLKGAADRIEALIAKLATCEKYRDAYDEMGRIGTQAVRDLEAKLAENEVRLGKAVEALKMMCEEFRGYDLPYGSKAYSQATSALAEIKSHSDEFATQKGENHDAR